MNNLKALYSNDSEKYKEILLKLVTELAAYGEKIEGLYNEGRFDELKFMSHSIRNLAGAVGQSKLKIAAAYWEEVCEQKRTANINDFKQLIDDVLKELQDEL